MSFNEAKLYAKLKSLDETQPTIVSISEWILFHHDHADQSIKVWADYTGKAAPMQKVPLLYLANEIIQKARAAKRQQFADGFAAVLPAVLAALYPRLDAGAQAKYRRVLGIWRDRRIFEGKVMEQLYAAIRQRDAPAAAAVASAAATQRPVADMAPELVPLSSAYNRLSHSSSLYASHHLKFESIFKELFDNEHNLPAPDIFLAKLEQLRKLNEHSQNSLQDMVSIRESLIRDLTRVVRTQTDAIESDRAKLASLQEKSARVAEKKRELEEFISGDETGTDYNPEGDDDDDDDDDEMVPTYANSDSDAEDGADAGSAPKRQKVDDTSAMDESEEESPQYEDSDSDAEQEAEQEQQAKQEAKQEQSSVVTNSVAKSASPSSINPNLASLLSKLSE